MGMVGIWELLSITGWEEGTFVLGNADLAQNSCWSPLNYNFSFLQNKIFNPKPYTPIKGTLTPLRLQELSKGGQSSVRMQFACSVYHRSRAQG